MNANIVGALENLETFWMAFEHKGQPMKKEDVRKVLIYGIQQGYEHTGQITDEDVDKIVNEKRTVLVENKTK